MGDYTATNAMGIILYTY